MRRLIAYVSMATAMLIGVGASFAPTFSKMKEGREFTDSREIVYEIQNVQEGEDAKPVDSKKVESIAQTMRNRLDALNIEDYSVKIGTSNEDSNERYSANISVSFSTNDETLFNYASRLLEFSKADLSLRSTNEEAAAENVFENIEARIERDSGAIPYVVIPVSNTEEVKSFLKVVSGEEEEEEGGESKASFPIIKKFADVEEGEEEGEASTEPDVFIVANWSEGDSISKKDENPYISEKLVMAFHHDNIWNPNSKEAETEFRFLCGSVNEQGEYDINALKKANQQAFFLTSMINASNYEYKVTNLFKNVSKDAGITYNYLTNKASSEALISFFNNDTRIAKSATFTATIVAVIIISLLLVMFFRVQAIGAIATTLASIFLTYLLFFAMTPTFNIAAIIGGVVITGLSLFGEIAYMHKFREEVYRGRSLRKANTEAMRRTNLLVLDASVIVAFVGLMFYVLGGEALKSFGVIAFFGAIINLLMYQLPYRLMNWLVANASGLQTKYSAFNIDQTKVPNLALDEKETYVSPYENKDFTKHKKPIAVLAGVLVAAAVAGISVFGVLKGSPLNIESSTRDTTTIYTVVDEETKKLDSTSFKNNVLKNIFINGKSIDVDGSEVVIKDQVRYNTETGLDETKHYYVSTLPSALENKNVSYQIDETKYDAESIQEAVQQLVYKTAVISSGVNVDVQTVSETVSTPNQVSIAVATAVAIAGASLYVALRYRPSRGLSLLVVSAGTSAVAYGAVALTRVATTAASAILLPIVAVSTFLIGLMYLDKEKELTKDEKGKPSIARRKEIMIKSLSRAAMPIFTLLIVLAYLVINFFGFGHASFAVLFGGALAGVLLGAVAVLTLAGPLACALDKAFSKIKLPKIRRKSKSQVSMKPKTSEPQETIFIGIND